MIRKELPFWTGLAAGAIVVADYFLRVPAIAAMAREVLQWRVILAAFALALGIGNLTRIHVTAVTRKKAYWPFSLILLAGLYGYLVLGLLTTTRSISYKFVFDNLYQPLSGTWYSITVFYMMSATWRAFRIRNAQAGVMLASAALVMLGQVGAGALLWRGLPTIASWLMTTGQNAGMRGITISASLGMVALSLRVILGLERSHMGGVGE
jgi:uncharacterized integral membrane protein